MAEDIIFEERGAWGVVTLNRPQALNALTWPMVEAFRARLMDWELHPSIEAVLAKGAGDKAFCAGGDIRWLHDEAKRDPVHACGFFREEYRNNAAIYHFPKPYVSLIDGVTMGGGVGVSVHGDFRVAGDRTLFAMPETGIGLFPDVGGGHFMPRLKGGLGLYFALTGARAKAADCMAAGIATHYTPTDRMAALEDALLASRPGLNGHGAVEAVLDEFAADPGQASINDLREAIGETFTDHETLGGLMIGLKARGGSFADETLQTLRRMSPTSMKVTFEQMKRGAGLDFDDVMRMEFRIVRRVMEGHDFFEGVRAQIIDKDRNPKWEPADVDAVSDDAVAAYFDVLDEEELILP